MTFGASILTVIELLEFCVGSIFSFLFNLKWKTNTSRGFDFPHRDGNKTKDKEDKVPSITSIESYSNDRKKASIVTLEDLLLY